MKFGISGKYSTELSSYSKQKRLILIFSEEINTIKI